MTMNSTKPDGSEPVAGPVDQPVRPLGAEVLHCYAQHSWHTEAYISGGKDALTALRNAIDAALSEGAAELRTVTSDGEGYSLYIVAMSDEDAENQVVPYTADYAAQPWVGTNGPWDRVHDGMPEFVA